MSEATQDYSFINILKKTLLFIRTYPKAFGEIIYKNLLLGSLAFVITLVLYQITVTFGIPMLSQGSNAVLLYAFLIPLNLFATDASFKPLRVVVASVYRKYIYHDLEKYNSFKGFVKIYSLTFRQIFALDMLVIFALMLMFKSTSFFPILGVIAFIYIGTTRLFKFIKLQCLPLTCLLENIDEEKPLLERVYQLPLGGVILMNAYEVTICLFNVVPFSLATLLVSPLGDSDKGNFIYFILVLLSILILNSFGDIASTIYYDIRSKHNFQKTTNIIGSIVLMLVLCTVCLVINQLAFD